MLCLPQHHRWNIDMSHFADQLKSLFIGDDIFISYARGDATGYALALANRLGERGFICYLDQYGTGPNDEVDEQVLRKLRISRVFVLVGSRLAIGSKPIEQEVNCFKTTARAIIAIDVDRAFRDTRLYSLVRGLPLADDPQVLNETVENLRNGSPSPEIVDQIEGTIDNLRRSGPSSRITDRIASTLSYTKRTQLQRAMLWGGSTFLLLSVGIALTALISAGRADRRRAVAEGRRAAAESAAVLAQTKLNAAVAETVEAQHTLERTSAEVQQESRLNGALQQIEQAARLRNEKPSEALALTAAAFRAAPDAIQSTSALANTLQYYRHLRLLMLTDSTDPVVTLTSALNGRVLAFGNGSGSPVTFYDTQAQRRITLKYPLVKVICTPVGSLCAEPPGETPFAFRFVSQNGGLQVEPLDLANPIIDPGPYVVTNDERIIAYDSREQRFLIWSLAKRTEDPQKLTCSGDPPTALAVSPDNKTLAFATTRLISSVQLVLDTAVVQINYCSLDNADTQPTPTELPGRSVRYVSRIGYSQDGKFLAVASGGGVSLIDAATRAVIASVKDVDEEFAFVPLRDSSSGAPEISDANRAFQLLVTSDSRRITAWEITKQPIGGERLFKRWQDDYAPGTTTLTTLNDAASTLLSGGPDGAISFWDFNANPFLEKASYTRPPPNRTRISVRHAILSGYPDQVFLDVQNPHGAPQKIPIPIGQFRSVDINENATLLALVRQTWADGTHGGVELWNVRDPKKPERLQPLYVSGDATCVAFGHGGSLALGYDNGRIAIWDVNSRKEIRDLASPITVTSRSLGRYPDVKSMAFRPDGKLLASSSSYRPLNLWDVETGTLIWSLERSGYDRSQNHEEELAFSQDGKNLFSSFQGVTREWDVDPYSWAERALRLASRTPAALAPLPIAPIAELTSAKGDRNPDPRVGYWRYQSGSYLGSGTGSPPPALYIQVIQGQLAITECDLYSDCLRMTPSPQGFRSLTVLPDGRLEYKWVVRATEGEASALVYYTRAAP